MRNYNPDNERVKREYLIFLEESRGQDQSTTDSVAKAIHDFEKYNSYRDFKKFHIKQAIGFKRHLAELTNKQTGQKLSKSTLNTTLRHLKGYFQWLAMQPGYKSRITYTDTEYFNLLEKEARVAGAHRDRPVPSLEQIRHVINTLPAITDIQLRDRALIAFTILTGARDSAIASIKLKHVDIKNEVIYQDGREVKTKFSKTFKTFYFPVGEDIRELFDNWVKYLKYEKLWGDDEPLFPKTAIVVSDKQQFTVNGLDRAHWGTTKPIRKIFKSAFQIAGLPYFNPHSFRKTLARLGEKMCSTPEEFKAWSQNLGHEQVLTTLTSYGDVQSDRQAEIIKNLSIPDNTDSSYISELAKALASELQKKEIL